MNKLEIYPVNIKNHKCDKKLKHIPTELPKPPFLLIIQAPVRLGKSCLIMNLIYRWYKKVFDEIIFVSPTVKNDKTLKVLYKDDDIIKIDEDLDNGAIDDIIDNLIEEQNDLDDDEREHKLLVLDDCLGFLKQKLAYLCSRFRHYKISICISSQSFRSIPLICRVNSSAYILFRTHNKKELSKLDEEFSGNFPNFLELYEKATKEKYSFLYLDNENIIARKNFNEILYKKD
tara:strand:- start:59 stop:751 length:693 start_codon:yes stop_codon:yes gene_type:complete